MKAIAKLAFAVLMAGSAAVGTSAPANADVGISFGFGSPGYRGDYDYGRPCWFYRRWHIPAPARCYRDFYGYYGPRVVIIDGFVFRDRDDFGRWRDRDDYRRWSHHGFHDRDRGDGTDRGWHDRDHHDRDDDRRDRDHDGRGDWHDHDHH